MRGTLFESRRTRPRRFAGALVSVTTHTGLILLAVVATARGTARVALAIIRPDAIVYTASPPARTKLVTSSPPATPLPPRLDIHRLIFPHLVICDCLPPIDHAAPPTAPDDFVTSGASPLHAGLGVLGGAPTGEPTNGVYTDRLVDKAVIASPGNPAPTYPATLREAHIEGNVLVHFVVDTTGRAELGSIEAIQSEHPLFAAAVRQAIERSRYLPAEVGGRRVRQLVEQRFAFLLAR